MFDNPNVAVLPPNHLKLDDLGNNHNGVSIRARVIDTQFLRSTGMATFGITPSTHHRRRAADILFSAGHARFVVDLSGSAEVRSAFDKILKVLEQADTGL